MYNILAGKTAEGKTKAVLIDDDRKLVLAGIEVEPPEGGATEEAQDEQTTKLTSIDDKLPALSSGRVPVEVDKIPAAQSLSGTLTTPTAPILGALSCGYSAALSRPIVAPVDSTGVGSVIARKHPPASRSGGTALQAQRTIASFSCTPAVVRAYSDTAGYIALFNKGSAVTGSDVPYGGHVYPIAAGGNVTIEWEYREPFTNGLVVAHLTAVTDGNGSLSLSLSTTARCMFTGQYD